MNTQKKIKKKLGFKSKKINKDYKESQDNNKNVKKSLNCTD